MSTTQIINLCFHGIGKPRRELEPGEGRYWIGLDYFRQVLDEILPRDDIRLSFDDGNASDVELALPELKDRGLRATFFVIADRLDTGGSLTTSEVRQLAEQGMGVGSHGMRHIPWRGLSVDQRYEEFVLARQILSEASGGPIVEAAMPLGRYDRRVLGSLKSAGYEHVFSSDRLRTRSSAWLQPRYSATATDTVTTLRTEILSSQPFAATAVPLVKSWVKRIR